MNWRAVVGVTAAALAIRVAYVGIHGVPAFLTGDAQEYHAYAMSLLHDGRYEGPRGEQASRMPGYPLFLALCGGSIGAALILQCLAGAAVCLLLHAAAANLLEEPWPLVCAIMAAVYFNLFSASAYLLSECLYGFLLASFAAVILSKKARPLFAGFLLAGAYFVRPESLPWAFLVMAGLPWLVEAYKPRHAAAGLAVLLSIAGLWTARNYAIFHRLVPISTVGGYNVYLGLRLPLGPVAQPPSPLPELDRDLWYRGEFHQYFHSLPWKTIAKAYAFDLGSLFYPFLPEYDFTYVILLPFWLCGFWAARKDKRLWPFCALILLSAATYTFVGGPVSRYRRGFSPYLILLAVVGMRVIKERSGTKRFSWSLGSWSALNLLIWGFPDAFRRCALFVKGGLLGP